MPILFDTGALELLRRRHRRAEKLALDFFPPVLCPAVVGEFLYGQLLAEVSPGSLLEVQVLLESFELRRPDSTTALIYARWRSRLKRTGVVLPDPDFWIAAQAMQQSIPLASTDRDFEWFDELRLFLLRPE